MDTGILPSSTAATVAGYNPFSGATLPGNSPASPNTAQTLHVDVESSQVTLSSNSTLQFAIPTNLLQSAPLYTGLGLAGLQSQYTNNLLAPNSGNGTDLAKSEQTLGSFAEQELASQIGTGALANATITFDNFSTQSSNTASLTQSQTQIQATQNQGNGTAGTQADLSQSTTTQSQTSAVNLEGSGHITLANGQTIAFKAELDVSTAVTDSHTVSDLAVSSTSQVAAPTSNPAPAAPQVSAEPAAAATGKSHRTDDWTTLLGQYANLMDVINSVKAGVDALRHSHAASKSASGSDRPIPTSGVAFTPDQTNTALLST